MSARRMEHVGIVVEDLAAALEFFGELGLENRGEMSVAGDWVDRIVGLDDVEADTAMMQAPEGGGQIELIQFNAPPLEDGDSGAPPNTAGLRHLAFAVDDVETVIAKLEARGAELVGELETYEDSWRLCYLRGPAGIIVELAEKIAPSQGS